MEKKIYHICTPQSWQVQDQNKFYAHASLASEGFIHMSYAHQVEGVLERYYDGVSDLLKLTVDVSKLTSPLIDEAATGGELFPHIYGPLHKDAIVEVEQIR